MGKEHSSKADHEPQKRLTTESETRLLQSHNEDPDPDDHIRRYIVLKADDWGVSFDEAAKRSMALLCDQMSRSENIIVVITAFPSERTSLKASRERNRTLAQDIRSFGWGCSPVLGGFTKTAEDGQVREVHEELFVVNASGVGAISNILRLLQKYDQEAALVKLPNRTDAMLLFPDGKTESVGRWNADPEQMSNLYARMRLGTNDRQFRFVAGSDDSVMTRYAVHTFFKSPPPRKRKGIFDEK